jgi:hypothetical protein
MKQGTVRRWGEILGWAITASLIVALLLNPDGPWERWLTASAFLIMVFAKTFNWLRPPKPERFASDAARAQHREAMRQLLQGEIYRRRGEQLRQDVVVRDLSRMDSYPDVLGGGGISPWFLLGLVDTYDKGIVVGLRIGGLKECEAGYRFVDWINGEKGDHVVYLLGDVPYDSIGSVNLDGDEYYGYAHIYCHFDFEGQPYRRLWFGRQVEISGNAWYYEHVADYDAVARNNPVDGTLHFG